MRLFNFKNLLLVLLALLLFISVKGRDEKIIAENDALVSSALLTASQIMSEQSIETQAESVLVGDLLNNKTIFNFNSEKRWPLASLTKLMTAVVALKVMPQAEIIPVTEEAVGVEGSTPGLEVGDSFELKELIRAMLLVSSNDAAKAIALHYGEDKFTQIMNAEAKDLGMKDTSFVDSSGLSSKNMGTASDLEKLVKFIFLRNRELLNITKEKSGIIVDEGGESKKLSNINHFAGRPDFLGGKTGTMPQVGGNLISVFSAKGGSASGGDINGPKLIIVLGAEDKFKETEKIIGKLWSKKQ